MIKDEPRRYLLAVGIGTYASSQWPALGENERELARMVDLLTSDSFQYQRILEDITRRPERGALIDALADWCASSDRLPDDHLLVYWTGHGEVDAENLYLILPDTKTTLGGALGLNELINTLFHSSVRIGPVLLLLDLCCAEQAIIDVGERWGALKRSRNTTQTSELGIICAASARGPARQLVFVDAFVDAVQRAIDPDKRLPPALPLSDILNRMTQGLGNKVAFPFSFSGVSEWLFLRNPHCIPHWPRDIDTATESLLGQVDSVARGVFRASSEGWLFKGRKQAFSDLCAWLLPNSAPGLCRVTGCVGAGKSALLARLYTLSLPGYRDHVPPHALGGTELPAPGAIDAMILSNDKSAAKIFTELVDKLRLQAVTPDGLVKDLRQRGRVPVLLFDGLDEAERSDNVLALLETLAGSAARVIVGVRSPYAAGSLPAALTIDLDAPPWSDPGAVEDYVVDRLRSEAGGDGPDPAIARQDLEGVAREIVAGAQGNFLIASLMVTSRKLASTPEPDAAVYAAPVTVAQAFDRIFNRLPDEETERTARDVLLPLAFVEGSGLPKGALWCALASRLSDRDYRPGDVDAVFRKLPWFLRETLSDGDSAYRLFHVALAEHLRSGRNAARLQQIIAATLRSFLAPPAAPGSIAGADALFARRHLAAHLRRAGSWQELGQLVMSPDWIASKTGRLPFENAGLAADMEQALQAARDANAQAVEQRRAAPALAETVWPMVWRSAHVTLLCDTPPAVWPLLVQAGDLNVGDALRLLAGIDDELMLASRLAALALFAEGADLERLIDFAAGIVPRETGSASTPSAPVEPAEPLEWYEAILLRALRGRDGRRLARRALDLAATTESQDYRCKLLTAALPLLDTAELAFARELIDKMPPSRLDRAEASARANHTVECVRRGDPAAAALARALPRDSMGWWYTAARLFAHDKATANTVLPGLDPADELMRADATIDDGIMRLYVLAEFMAALPTIDSSQERAALAVFLRRLHASSRTNHVVRRAAQVARHLPMPHAARLLHWARGRLLRASAWPHYDSNIDWMRTPCILARAFAGAGDLTAALDLLAHAHIHEFYLPRAYADVAMAHLSAPNGGLAGPVDLERLCTGRRGGKRRLQFACALAAALDVAQQPDILYLLSTVHLQMARDLVPARCAVLAERVHYAPVADIGALLRQFLGLVPGQATRSRFAQNCARSGHAQAALDTLATLSGKTWQRWAWESTLAAAAPSCHPALLAELARDEALAYELLTSSAGCDALSGIAAQAGIEIVSLMSGMTARLRPVSASYDTLGLTYALAVRAFELDEPALTRSLLGEEGPLLSLLRTASRLPTDSRKAFIRLVPVSPSLAWPDSTRLFRLVSRYFVMTEDEQAAFGLTIVDAVIGDPAAVHFCQGEAPLLDLFAGHARDSLIAHAKRTILDSLEAQGTVSSDLGHQIRALLPAMNAPQLKRLVQFAQRQHSDYHREDALVLILPRYAQLYGPDAAFKLQSLVHRPDFEALSLAAIWPVMPPDKQAEIFARLTQDGILKGGSEPAALALLAPRLSGEQLADAMRWIISFDRRNDHDHLVPLVDAALQRPPAQVLACWEAVTGSATRLSCADAAGWIAAALPMAARLGGGAALDAIDAMLARAAAQWPTRH